MPKKGKVGRVVKKEERWWGWGRKIPASIYGPRVTWEELLLSTTFQVVTVENWSQTYKLQQFEQREGHDLRLKKA
jgi:hypothetical protein